MLAQNQTVQKLAPLFSEQPCWQLETLADQFCCSARSIQRYLSISGYYRSFSHNGKWYTLHHVPKFNLDGLWFSDDIGFSRAGNLNNTMVRLVTKSPVGMSAEDLGEKLRCRCHSVLVQLYRNGKLQREKIGRSFVYFAQDARVADNQLKGWESLNVHSKLLPAEIAVLILAEFIRNPQISFEQLAKTMQKTRNVSVKAVQIEKFFEQHGLKKTLHNALHWP
ncbi:MAG: hypothetical protein ABR542_05790 [Desulfonatronovibrio sp.]|nr:hypothetical protein [Desulfovibrionales bacterium]